MCVLDIPELSRCGHCTFDAFYRQMSISFVLVISICIEGLCNTANHVSLLAHWLTLFAHWELVQ